MSLEFNAARPNSHTFFYLAHQAAASASSMSATALPAARPLRHAASTLLPAGQPEQGSGLLEAR